MRSPTTPTFAPERAWLQREPSCLVHGNSVFSRRHSARTLMLTRLLLACKKRQAFENPRLNMTTQPEGSRQPKDPRQHNSLVGPLGLAIHSTALCVLSTHPGPSSWDPGPNLVVVLACSARDFDWICMFCQWRGAESVQWRGTKSPKCWVVLPCGHRLCELPRVALRGPLD